MGKFFFNANVMHLHSKCIASALHVDKPPQKAENPILGSIENQMYDANALQVQCKCIPCALQHYLFA